MFSSILNSNILALVAVEAMFVLRFLSAVAVAAASVTTEQVKNMQKWKKTIEDNAEMTDKVRVAPRLYGLFKQATLGDATPEQKNKGIFGTPLYAGWEGCRGMGPQECYEEYAEIYRSIVS